MKITQSYRSGALGFNFGARYGFKEYKDKNSPTVFFGCYDDHDLKVISEHKAFGIVVWCGTDGMRINNKWARIFHLRKNIKHIAISNYLERDLKKFNIPYKFLPLTPTLPKPNPQPLGTHIYVYIPHHNPDFYGLKYMPQIIQRLSDIHIIRAWPGKYDKKHLNDIYKACFIGLRLTPHDGLPNTVLELGLMGRRCIWNGNAPNAIAWEDIIDICMIISEEELKIGQTDNKLAQQVAEYIDIDDDWLNTEYWK